MSEETVTSTDVTPPTEEEGGDRRFLLVLGGLGVVGFVVRFTYVWWFHREAITKGLIGGDSYFYHYGANLLVDGHGFIGPEQYLLGHFTLQSAIHPPLYLLTLAAGSVFGLRSYTAHQLLSCVIGAGTVFMVGLAAREVSGGRARAGLIAAGLAAIYPFMWLIDGAVMSETDMLFTAALVIYTVYRCWHRPTTARAAWAGVAVGLAALTRAEEILLALFILVPLCLWLRDVEWRRRLQLLVVTGLAVGITIGPWCVYNLTRFHHPELLSTGFGQVMSVAYCDQTFHGQYTGWWWLNCDKDLNPPISDESDQDVFLRQAAEKYARHHLDRLPVVMFARAGRTFGFYHAGQQIFYDQIEQRPLVDSQLGLVMYYLMLVPAAVGVAALRRARRPVFPMAGLVGAVLFVSVVVYGITRFRAPAEVALVVLAGFGIDALAQRAAVRFRT